VRLLALEDDEELALLVLLDDDEAFVEELLFVFPLESDGGGLKKEKLKSILHQ
jgi:hypothetical protein